MNVSNWLGDANSYQNGDANGIAHGSDPSMDFLQGQPSFDLNETHSVNQSRLMHNGGIANGSPLAQQSPYPTQSTIPLKRSRPPDEALSASSGQFAGNSRSQTPHTNYQGYTGPANGSMNTTSFANAPHSMPPARSPSIPDQTFNPVAPQQQRVQTMSPSPFSPAPQHMGGHISPPHSDIGSPASASQNNVPFATPGQAFANGPGQPFIPQGTMGVAGSQAGIYNPQMNETRNRQMAAAAAASRSQQSPPPTSGPLSGQSTPSNANLSAQQYRPQNQPRQPPQQLQQMLHDIIAFARQRNPQFNPQPMIANRPLNCVSLFMGVLRMGGSKRISMNNQWANVAQFLGFAGPQLGLAGQELQNYWQTSLADYETFYMQQQSRQRNASDPANTMGGISKTADAMARQVPAIAQKPGQTKVLGFQADANSLPPKAPLLQAGPQVAQTRMVNGAGPMQLLQGHPAVNGIEPQFGAGIPDESSAWVSNKKPLSGQYVPKVDNSDVDLDHQGASGPPRRSIDPDRSTYGGLTTSDDDFIISTEALLKYKLQTPTLAELGPLDLRSLTHSIRSELKSELRYALDTLVALSATSMHFSLDACEDLVEALVECAEAQVDILASESSPGNETPLPYEEASQRCQDELGGLQEQFKAGTQQRSFEYAANNLVCISNILRNFSFGEASFQALSDPIVFKMIASVLRYVTSRSMVLVNHNNTMDFSKDVLLYLSQIAHLLELDSREDMSSLLQFFISFGPEMGSAGEAQTQLEFLPFSPIHQPYLPLAIDGLSRLLTRQTNRDICRSLFTTDNMLETPSLLAMAFGMVISPLPAMSDDEDETLRIIEHRLPCLAQGMLAAEILVGMISEAEQALVNSWLHSEDQFPSRLMKMVTVLFHQMQLAHVSTQQQHKNTALVQAYYMLADHALTMLVRLLEKLQGFEAVDRRSLRRLIPVQKIQLKALTAEWMHTEFLNKLSSIDKLTADI